MKVYIGLSLPIKPGLFALLIKNVEARPFDHCYFKFQDNITKEWIVSQASGLVVNNISFDLFKTTKNVVKEYEIEIDDEKFISIMQFIENNLGKPYSLLEDFGILLMKIFHLKNQPFSQGNSAWYCAAYVAQICILAGISIIDEINSIDPSRMDQILSSKGLICVTT